MRRVSERLEYVKQPHIIVLIIVVVLLISTAIITGSRRIAEISRNANKTTEERCLEYVNDPDLCKFAATQETSGLSNYISTTREVNENDEQITVLEVENPNRLRSLTTQFVAEREAYIILDGDNYVKDYSDGYWALYTDSEYTPELGGIMYDFTSTSSDDTVLFRDKYKRIGSEPCGPYTCLKYQITDLGQPSITTYIWFDTETYLIQRQHSRSTNRETDTRYEYKTVTITAPSPIKRVSEDEIIRLLE